MSHHHVELVNLDVEVGQLSALLSNSVLQLVDRLVVVNAALRANIALHVSA